MANGHFALIPNKFPLKVWKQKADSVVLVSVLLCINVTGIVVQASIGAYILALVYVC